MEAWQAGGAETSQENLEVGVPSEEMIALLYRELHDLASAWMAKERASHTLTATGVVHEAYLKLARPGRTWPNRAVFFSAAAEAMRRVLIDHARRKHAAKRGGKDATKRPVLTIGGGGPDGPSSFDPVYGVLELSSVLDKLKEIDPQAHRVVMLRYFAGLSEAQTAELIGRSERQVRRIWVGARAWLHERLETEPGR